ncbi:MAG TPA: hypothetical protein VNY05_34655 [Candidatus Acidoferrales bacterium]|nr:hypothetical protein [Candidatus Acidoferrales bacterium]
MRKLIWIAPVLLWAGCSKMQPPSGSGNGGASAVAQPAAVEKQVPTIPAGTPLHVRLDESVSTRANRAGDGFTATLSAPIEVGGRTLVPAGTQFNGHITAAAASGRMKGRAVIGLTLDSFDLGGRNIRVRTTRIDRVSDRHKKRNAWLIGGGAALGGAIGAIAGGPKGALIGAGAGAGAGTAGAAITGKKQVGVVSETPLRFTLEAAVEM